MSWYRFFCRFSFSCFHCLWGHWWNWSFLLRLLLMGSISNLSSEYHIQHFTNQKLKLENLKCRLIHLLKVVRSGNCWFCLKLIKVVSYQYIDFAHVYLINIAQIPYSLVFENNNFVYFCCFLCWIHLWGRQFEAWIGYLKSAIFNVEGFECVNRNYYTLLNTAYKSLSEVKILFLKNLDFPLFGVRNLMSNFKEAKHEIMVPNTYFLYFGRKIFFPCS